MEYPENNIEFISGTHYATVTFSNRRHMKRVKNIYETRSSEFKYFYENEDGTICAKLPLKWIKINPGVLPSADKPKRTMTEEQKKAFVERVSKSRKKK